MTFLSSSKRKKKYYSSENLSQDLLEVGQHGINVIVIFAQHYCSFVYYVTQFLLWGIVIVMLYVSLSIILTVNEALMLGNIQVMQWNSHIEIRWCKIISRMHCKGKYRRKTSKKKLQNMQLAHIQPLTCCRTNQDALEVEAVNEICMFQNE